jgi:hypothetical protein
MYIIIDNKLKLIFAYTHKCGSTHVVNLFYYIVYNELLYEKSYPKDQTIPNNIDEYKIFVFIRNPYKRIVSGFLHGIIANEFFMRYWYTKFNMQITFYNFIKNIDIIIDDDHFKPQMSGPFFEIIKNRNDIIYYDIENINYDYLEKLFNINIIDNVKNLKGIETNNGELNKITDYVYDINPNNYIKYNVPLYLFYNNDINLKVNDIYKDDFLYFKSIGFNYNDL